MYRAKKISISDEVTDTVDTTLITEMLNSNTGYKNKGELFCLQVSGPSG